jgi:hypothetical protein
MVFASQINRHVRTGLVAGLVALAAGSACVQEQDYLVVENAVWFGDREDCTLTNDSAIPLAMTVDVSFQTRIAMGFVIANNQTPNPGSNSGIDDSDIEVESVEVRLTYSGGAIPSDSFEMPVPNNTIPGGEELAFLVQAPTEVTEAIRASMTPGQFETLEMEVVFKGRKYGASGGKKLGEVTTRAYTYPFDVCLGCLTDCTCLGECTSDTCSCPTAFDWSGTCGFAQGLSVIEPGCGAEEETG